jgi:hypothetical protein
MTVTTHTLLVASLRSYGLQRPVRGALLSNATLPFREIRERNARLFNQDWLVPGSTTIGGQPYIRPHLYPVSIAFGFQAPLDKPWSAEQHVNDHLQDLGAGAGVSSCSESRRHGNILVQEQQRGRNVDDFWFGHERHKTQVKEYVRPRSTLASADLWRMQVTQRRRLGSVCIASE